MSNINDENMGYGDRDNKFNGIYRGIVENIDDPEFAGRLKIRVFGIHTDDKDNVPTKTLPWAIPAPSFNVNGGGLRNIGDYSVPPIGSHVYVFFEGGDHNFPTYFAMAPAIEDTKDYEEKNGTFDEDEYGYTKRHQYDISGDPKSNYHKEQFETKIKGKSKHPVQDYLPQTRKNTFSELTETVEIDEDELPENKETDSQFIFPENFFQTDIRVAFDGKANHDAPNYYGIHHILPSNNLEDLQEKQELDRWDERKWGHNDNDNSAQHDYNGGPDWKPTYPMCHTIRNQQGEIIDTDILKERRTYIHPSKYFIEHIQLDATREKEDFLNERAVKRVYERQRGVGNSPDDLSTPKKVNINGNSNLPNPIQSDDEDYSREKNEITYDEITLDEDGNPNFEERKQKLQRFEERKHNVGREKTVIEDIVYRYYINKVNETYANDRNYRIYVGNDNLEIEHGDRNYRLHRGSHNQHLDEGNYSRIVNKGWEHLHIDQGHHFIEIGGENKFETSSTPEEDGNPQFDQNQHANIASGSTVCQETYLENAKGNQYFYLHDGHQTFRLKQGHQHFHLIEGCQYFLLDDGDQDFRLKNGNQTFILDNGDMTRNVNGAYSRETTGISISYAHNTLTIKSDISINIESPNINILGNINHTGNMITSGTHTDAIGGHDA